MSGFSLASNFTDAGDDFGQYALPPESRKRSWDIMLGETEVVEYPQHRQHRTRPDEPWERSAVQQMEFADRWQQLPHSTYQEHTYVDHLAIPVQSQYPSNCGQMDDVRDFGRPLAFGANTGRNHSQDHASWVVPTDDVLDVPHLNAYVDTEAQHIDWPLCRQRYDDIQQTPFNHPDLGGQIPGRHHTDSEQGTSRCENRRRPNYELQQLSYGSDSSMKQAGTECSSVDIEIRPELQRHRSGTESLQIPPAEAPDEDQGTSPIGGKISRPPWSRRKYDTRLTAEGKLQVREFPDSKWEDTVSLDRIRRQLIDEQAQLGSYDFPDHKGSGGPHDLTAFHQDYQHSGSRYENRSDILFEFEEKKGCRPKYDPGWMRFQHRVVLDPEDKPIRDFKEIPKCLSSRVSGARIEEICRRNLYIDQRDIRGRFPSVLSPKKGRKELPKANTMVNMKRLRFREKAGLLSWPQNRNEQKLHREHLAIYLNVQGNSIKGFGRDLTIWEVKFLNWAADKIGSAPKKAGSRKLSDSAREAKMTAQQQTALDKLRETNILGPQETFVDAYVRFGLGGEGDDQGENGSTEDGQEAQSAILEDIESQGDVLLENEYFQPTPLVGPTTRSRTTSEAVLGNQAAHDLPSYCPVEGFMHPDDLDNLASPAPELTLEELYPCFRRIPEE